MCDTQIEIPLGLKSALEARKCALFLGAGLGEHIRDASGNPSPNGTELAADMAARFGFDAGENPDLAKVAEIVELRRGRKELETHVHSRLSGLEPDEKFRWLFQLSWKAIFTTNYDSAVWTNTDTRIISPWSKSQRTRSR